MKTNLSHSKIIFDIEADGLNPTVVWCIVAKELDGDVHTFDNTQIEEGIKFLQTADVLIGHNIIGYDLPALKRLHNAEFRAELEDTLVMSRLYNPIRENGHSLKTWGYRVNCPKQEQPEDFDSYTPEMLEYCIQDVKLNEKVYKSLVEEGRSFSKESIVLEQQVADVIKDQERNGFYFDSKQAMTLLADLKAKMFDVETEVQQTFKPKWVDDKMVTPYVRKDGQLSKRGLTDDEYNRCMETNNFEPFMRKTLQEFNLGSRKQIGEYLIDFGWKPVKFTPTGQPIVDEGTLKKIEHIREAKLIADYLLYQKRIAQVTSWIDELQGDRVHGGVISNGTITGRMSHRSPNLAQVPNMGSPFGKECRSCWTVPEGYKLVGIDASGLELRMLAHYMNDQEYINEVVNGDIHTTNQKLAGLKSRDQAKTFIYALVYGAGDEKIGKVAGGTRKHGSELKRTFLNNLPALKKLRDRVQQASRRGFLKGLDGRKIYVRSQHAALNTLLQGGGAIVMKKALAMLDSLLKLNAVDAKFVANIHDEWQMEVKESQADFVGELAVGCIEKAGEHFQMRCPLTGEYKIGDNWSETH
jgi:DNA polymerase I-like protein with 3'-5' exonuclease and polymerase domains|tara:strand:- start:1512 stop:3257 length:1746 start_codon:yes stop_codon:yes gene_type:complete